MNDWETDSKLKAGVVKENECLREEVAALKKEVAALKREKAERKKKFDKECDELIKLVIDSDEKGSFYYFTRVYIALYKHHNRGHRVPSIVIDELEQYKDTFLWELISKDLYSDDIA